MGDAGEVLTTLKLLIIGESGVGKSSLLLRFTDDAFDPEQALMLRFEQKTLKYWMIRCSLSLLFNVLTSSISRTFFKILKNELQVFNAS